jgi:hypothetical protein
MSYAPLGYYGLGDTASAAGQINGVATLRVDIQRTAANVVEAWGSEVSFDRGDYEAFLAQAKNDPGSLQNQQIPSARMRNFVYGIVGDVASAVARAEQVSRIQVSTPAERAENHRVQAELVGAARIMLDAANTALRNVVQVRNGASGLGAGPLIPVVLIAAAAVVYLVVGITVVAAVALCYDANRRARDARAAADRACEAQGGCTAEEYAEIVQGMSLGPLDTLAGGGAAAIQAVGLGTAATVAIVGVSAVALGALYFLFGTEAGRRTLKGAREELK